MLLSVELVDFGGRWIREEAAKVAARAEAEAEAAAEAAARHAANEEDWQVKPSTPR